MILLWKRLSYFGVGFVFVFCLFVGVFGLVFFVVVVLLSLSPPPLFAFKVPII